MNTTTLDKVRAFMRAHSWMELETVNPTEGLVYATRENGDVGEERPGRADVLHARDMRAKLQAAFAVKVEIDTCDEWINLTVTP